MVWSNCLFHLGRTYRRIQPPDAAVSLNVARTRNTICTVCLQGNSPSRLLNAYGVVRHSPVRVSFLKLNISFTFMKQSLKHI